ncbi:uncharacterized protein LOC124420953 [Lucilia cuprina]|uniref:uncharacterized protein LOC124420953 n=1 Tax=Lucilia cuprina TaxID=7375 RepID=UPI001F054A9B|nr:uncharacterized protein LOC124420953 [Lucilia cuprina]
MAHSFLINIFILFVIHYFQLVQNVNHNKDVKWYIEKNNLYYILMQSDHNWYNALSLCDDIGMDMLLKDKYELVTLVTKNYGDNIEYWLNGGIIRNNLCSYFKSSTVQQSKCSETKGVICESAMTGGTVRFKNGTEIKFGLEIPHYCELHEDMMIYNGIIDFCIIHYKHKHKKF